MIPRQFVDGVVPFGCELAIRTDRAVVMRNRNRLVVEKLVYEPRDVRIEELFRNSAHQVA